MSTASLRITSGLYRGRTIESPASPKTHPMGAREKLALMNQLTPYLSGAHALDAYAGSGALGLEALSRGAASITFVDSSRTAVATIRQNLQSLGLRQPVFCQTIQAFARNHQTFDLILADPPYDHFDPAEVALLPSLLADGGHLALSLPARLDPPKIPGLKLKQNRTYAAAQIAIYQKSAPLTQN